MPNTKKNDASTKAIERRRTPEVPMENEAGQDRPNDSERIAPGWAYRALADVYELPDSYRIVADMPGADLGRLELTLDEGVLRIDAPVSRPFGPGANDTWIHQEYGVGAYHRRFAIQESVDADAIGADYQNGTLLVTLPKKQPSARRRVPINAK